MNLSGQSVAAFLRKYVGVGAGQIMMVHDDLEHNFGHVRVKEGGSAQ